jgi:predicted dehydrogenase
MAMLNAFFYQPFDSRRELPELDPEAADAILVVAHGTFTEDELHRMTAELLYSNGPEIIEAARQTQRILQVGSQRVSSMIYKKAKDLIAAGAIGQITVINAWWDRNPNFPVMAFDSSIPPDASPETIDWLRFLGSAPNVPFNAEHFFQWRKWKAYGSGVAGDLFVHLFSGTHFITSSHAPTRAVAMGGLHFWRDGRDQPDVLLGLFDYPGVQSAFAR